MNMRYNKIAGIGGVGTGMLFHTADNTPLGRSESRLAELSDAKDYCKLHIVFHYVAVLLAPYVKIYPVGVVGKDPQGAALLDEMQHAGMDISYMTVDKELPTMTSICLQYPDGETCNFTASNSACNLTTPQYTECCLERMGIDGSAMVAAIPEVQVKSRIKILQKGKEKGAFCILSVPESEAEEFKQSGIFAHVDLLAVNESEALALAPGEGDEKSLTKRLYDTIRKQNPDIMLLVTCGKNGAYSAHDGHIEFIPVIPKKTVNTTGAGDACLGGTIVGLAMGLPFQKGNDDASFGASPLSSAVELGTLCAGMAIETADSIAMHVNLHSIDERIKHYGWERESCFPTYKK